MSVFPTHRTNSFAAGQAVERKRCQKPVSVLMFTAGQAVGRATGMARSCAQSCTAG